jgi:hypothetical protein
MILVLLDLEKTNRLNVKDGKHTRRLAFGRSDWFVNVTQHQQQANQHGINYMKGKNQQTKFPQSNP